MPSSNNFTFFQNASSGGAAASEYISDAFDDISLPASSNGAFTSTASTNPMSQLFNDDDAPKFGVTPYGPYHSQAECRHKGQSDVELGHGQELLFITDCIKLPQRDKT